MKLEDLYLSSFLAFRNLREVGTSHVKLERHGMKFILP